MIWELPVLLYASAMAILFSMADKVLGQLSGYTRNSLWPRNSLYTAFCPWHTPQRLWGSWGILTPSLKKTQRSPLSLGPRHCSPILCTLGAPTTEKWLFFFTETWISSYKLLSNCNRRHISTHPAWTTKQTALKNIPEFWFWGTAPNFPAAITISAMVL